MTNGERDGSCYNFLTLPDYLKAGLRLVFVGLNPGLYSVERGHYFARGTNRFWPAFSRSSLSAAIRTTLGKALLAPEDDAALLDFGIGFMDVVKVASANASAIKPALFAEWAPRLRDRLIRFAPSAACFHGSMAWQGFARYAMGNRRDQFALGEQCDRIAGSIRLFVVPNPSPANAHFTLQQQVEWYDRLADFLQEGE